MLELILVLAAGILVGAIAGLLPALPVFTGPLILYYFVSDYYSVEYLLIFWLASYSGTQFFGSIATITTKIPGEESSAIYLADIDHLNITQKRNLLYDTALGSWVASTLSLLFVWTVITFVGIEVFPQLLSMNVQLVIYAFAIVLFFFTGNNWIATAMLITLGLFIGPRQNYALPDFWFESQQFFQGYTLYMVVLGTILIPALTEKTAPLQHIQKFGTIRSKGYSVLSGIKNSIIGAIAGLIPGPSASVATAFAYKTGGNNRYKKILNAETANNSAVITCSIPFFLLGLPINQNTLLMSNIMDIQSIDIMYAILEPGMFGFRVIDTVIMCGLICMAVYFYLSTHLIDLYSNLVQTLHDKMKWIVLILLLALISVDLQYAETTLFKYTILLALFTVFGFILKHYNISAVPFLFALILADKIIWLTIQTITIQS